MIWLLAFAVAMGVLLAVAVIADHWPVWSVRRQLPPIGQPVRASAPPLPAPRPPARIYIDMNRARQARAERGRHRRPEV